MSTLPVSRGLVLGVLGGVWAELDGSRLALGGPRQRAVLAALIAARGSVLTLEQLVDAVWEDDPPVAAVGTVQTYISNLRRVLEPGRAARDVSRVLVTAAPGYVLRVDPEAVDAWRFERAVLGAGAGVDPVRQRAVLEEALGWWAGEPFAGVTGSGDGSGPVAAEVTRLRELRWSAMERLGEVLLGLGAYNAAEARARAVTVEAPLREEGWRLLALAQYAGGRAGDGLATLRRAREVLSEELGIDPGPALVRLEQQMLNRDVPTLTVTGTAATTTATTAAALDADESFADERNSRKPGPASLPPTEDVAAPSTSGASGVGTSSVVGAPVQLRPLVGRAVELDWLAHALGVRGDRLVTLTGAGGSGKTRLALAAAARLAREFGDGAHFVTVQNVSDVSAVWGVLAQHFEVPPGEAETSTAVVAALSTFEALLVLDNLEHLDGADGVVAALLEAPGLRILATSRRPLLLAGEQEYMLEALSLPTSDSVQAVESSEAGRFLRDCARAARPGFTVTEANAAAVAGLCRRLDGLPLALELAGAQLRFFGPAALLAHLGEHLTLQLGHGLTAGDRPERHRTLGATIAYSHDLLSDDDQVVFRRLGVFAGPVDLDAVMAVIGPADDGLVPVPDVYGSLSRLALSGLVRVDPSNDEPRFGMFDTIRDYARHQLEQAGEGDELRRRHLFWCSARAVDAWHRINFDGGHREGPAARPDEMRAALRFALGPDADAHADPDAVNAGIDLLNAAAIEWLHIGGGDEARYWIERALTLVLDSDRGRRAELLRQRTGQRTFLVDDVGPLTSELRQVLDGAPHDDLLLRARLHFSLGMLASRSGDYDTAGSEGLEAATLAAQAGATGLSSSAYHNACQNYLRSGRPDRVLEVVRPILESGQFAQRVHVPYLGLRLNAGDACIQLGDLRGAGQYLSNVTEHATILSQLDRFEWFPNLMLTAAELAAGCGRDRDSARLCGRAARTAGESTLTAKFEAESDAEQRVVAQLRDRLTPDEWQAAVAEGARMSEAEIFQLVEDIARDAASRPAAGAAEERPVESVSD